MDMKRACYCFSGREIWFQLSLLLRERGIEPVLWFSDPKHDECVKNKYPNCEVLDTCKTNKGLISLTSFEFLENHHNNCVPLEIIKSASFYKLKDQVMKMMDRQDDYLCYRHIDREAVFYSFINYFYRKIYENKIDVLICSDGPHSPAQYTLYSLCKMLNISRIHFLPSSIAPFMLMNRDIEGNWVKLDTPSYQAKSLQTIMHDYVDSLQVSPKEIKDPDYIIKQKELDKKALNRTTHVIERLVNKFKKEGFKGVKAAIINRQIGYKNFYTIQSLNFIHEPVKILVRDPKRNKIKNKIKKLQKDEYNAVVQQVSLENKYIYFPLHYEPERTTNPDGGDYYNSYDTLLALRSFVPNEIPIYVKEHYSQFSHALHGHRGRSHYFYRAILSIPNVVIISMDYSSIELIDNAELTASITGTACLEAACRGKKSLIFGNAWFSGCPNVYKFDHLNGYTELLNAPISSSHEIKEYFNDLIDQYAISGCVNPSNERLYNKYLVKHTFDKDMLQDICSGLLTLGVF